MNWMVSKIISAGKELPGSELPEFSGSELPEISSCGVELVKQDFLEIAFELSLFF